MDASGAAILGILLSNPEKEVLFKIHQMADLFPPTQQVQEHAVGGSRDGHCMGCTLAPSHMTCDFKQGRAADELAHPDYQGFRLVCDIPSPMAPVVHGKAESSPTRSNEMRDFSRQAHQCYTSAPLGAFSPEALGGTLSDGHLHTSARRGKGEVRVVIQGFRCARVC